MAAEAVTPADLTVTVDAGQVAPLHRPGFCAAHPDVALVTHRVAGEHRYGWEDPATVCTACPLDRSERERCTWCGDRLFPPDVIRWNVSERRAFCSSKHRIYAWRARRRLEATA